MAKNRGELNPRNKDTIEHYWMVWATHVENHSTLVQTAAACGHKSISQVCRILKWCAKQLEQDPVEVVQGQVWNKLRRLRAIQPKREQTMGEDNHQAAIGYLREERELENDIAKLQGAERHLVELTGPNGGPLQVQTEHSGSVDLNAAGADPELAGALCDFAREYARRKGHPAGLGNGTHGAPCDSDGDTAAPGPAEPEAD